MSLHLALFAAVALVSGQVPAEEDFVAADKGCAGKKRASCARLGKLIEKGDITVEEVEHALETLAAACDKKVAEACAVAAVSYDQGDNSEGRDAEQALSFFKKACALGDAASCASAKLLTRDSSKSVQAQRRAEEARKALPALTRECLDLRAPSCLKLGGFLEDKALTGEDAARALETLNTACDKQLPHACAGAARAYNLRGDRETALRLYTRACDLGVAASCFEVRLIRLMRERLGE
ncbi:MAG TPA: tetratricopeptide repeat protein [Archangium sp.]|nr:tetratricopeptide repeat protein [Archangium sp.]